MQQKRPEGRNHHLLALELGTGCGTLRRSSLFREGFGFRGAGEVMDMLGRAEAGPGADQQGKRSPQPQGYRVVRARHQREEQEVLDSHQQTNWNP